jgi:hypothetical protein
VRELLSSVWQQLSDRLFLDKAKRRTCSDSANWRPTRFAIRKSYRPQNR